MKSQVVDSKEEFHNQRVALEPHSLSISGISLKSDRNFRNRASPIPCGTGRSQYLSIQISTIQRCISRRGSPSRAPAFELQPLPIVGATQVVPVAVLVAAEVDRVVVTKSILYLSIHPPATLYLILGRYSDALLASHRQSFPGGAR